MSELKAFTFGLGQYTEDGSPCVVVFDGEKNPRLASDEKFYLKSEADKAIAHHKYKRCLAMADYCQGQKKYWHIRYISAAGYDRSYEKWKHKLLIKWYKRWLELAEKFKETK